MTARQQQLPDASWMTRSDYRWARVMAALDSAYADVQPKPGQFRPSQFVEAYERHHGWVRR